MWFGPNRSPVICLTLREGLGLTEQCFPSCHQGLWLPHPGDPERRAEGDGASDLSQAPVDTVWLQEEREAAELWMPLPLLLPPTERGRGRRGLVGGGKSYIISSVT